VTEKLPERDDDAHDRGRQILESSFTIIERELGPHAFAPWAFAVVRRMIHASADFEFARTLRYHPDFFAAFEDALRGPCTVVTDTEMVRLGILTAAADVPGLIIACHLPPSSNKGKAEVDGATRCAIGIREAAQTYPHPLLAIGNAPTALDEAVRWIEEKAWRPAAIIGMPVGFVGVVEAKERLLRQAAVPYLTCVGRKGGSAVTAAAVNALLELCRGS
jgi:precorrin-8X/cobalt-precorrin-8 methylmutase